MWFINISSFQEKAPDSSPLSCALDLPLQCRTLRPKSPAILQDGITAIMGGDRQKAANPPQFLLEQLQGALAVLLMYKLELAEVKYSKDMLSGTL